MKTTFNQPQNPVFISGPSGNLEAIIAPPVAESAPIVTIICHPHPLYGGTMNNKVVTTVARAMYDLGLWSLRFNFRGIGASQGVYGNGHGEVEDLLAVIDWVQQHFPKYNIWLAGFSFGAYIAMEGAARVGDAIQQLITIAPAVTHFEFHHGAKIHCPWLLLMGEADEIVAVGEVKKWVKKQPAHIKTIYFDGVSHFFHGFLSNLREQLKVALHSAI